MGQKEPQTERDDQRAGFGERGGQSSGLGRGVVRAPAWGEGLLELRFRERGGQPVLGPRGGLLHYARSILLQGNLRDSFLSAEKTEGRYLSLFPLSSHTFFIAHV